MKAPDFAYYRPETVAELFELLRRLNNTKLLAGGQSLMPMLNMRYVIPDHVVDINRIPDLDKLVVTKDAVRVGALVRQRELERSTNVKGYAPIFAEALAHVGHCQTRNRGTVGGSLCHLDPAAELVTLAALHDAVMHVDGPRGARDIAMESWVTGFMTPAIGPDEFLTAVTFPLWGQPCGEAFLEFARRKGDFAIAAVAVRVALDSGRIAKIALALGGLAVAPVRLPSAESTLLGAAADASVVDALKTEIQRLDVIDDAHASANYRKLLAATLMQRAFAIAVKRASGKDGNGRG